MPELSSQCMRVWSKYLRRSVDLISPLTPSPRSVLGPESLCHSPACHNIAQHTTWQRCATGSDPLTFKAYGSPADVFSALRNLLQSFGQRAVLLCPPGVTLGTLQVTRPFMGKLIRNTLQLSGHILAGHPFSSGILLLKIGQSPWKT